MTGRSRLGVRPAGEEERRYLTVPEAAAYLRLSKDYVYRRTASSTIPHHRIGRKILFTPEQLDQWVFELNTKGALTTSTLGTPTPGKPWPKTTVGGV